jgi:hypothetical protein
MARQRSIEPPYQYYPDIALDGMQIPHDPLQPLTQLS